jgi:hypothetical protein
MLQLVPSGCFKSRSGVAHEVSMESGRWRRQRPGQRGRRPRRCGTTIGALSHEPNSLGARSPLCEQRPYASGRFRRPGASKSVSFYMKIDYFT